MKVKKLIDYDKFDFGNNLMMSGVVMSGMNNTVVVLLPEFSAEMMHDMEVVPTTMGGFKDFIRQLDIQETKIFDQGKNAKIVVRKSQRQLDNRIVWQVFRRDNFKCRYCGDDESPMTYDHVMLWEDGGETSVENGVTACKKCNKTRGNMDYSDWLDSPYYKKVSNNITPEIAQLNEDIKGEYKSYSPRVSSRRR